jgi:hypothetical protein
MEKATEIGKNVNESVRQNLDNMRQQLLAYENQIKEYLDKVNANIDSYKFSVEKDGDGIMIDVAMRASIQPKGSTDSKK